MESSESSDLLVQGTPLQVLYSNYQSGRYFVNRRYQRKLVWTVEEKAKLIDSIVTQLPIPLVLLAEPRGVAESGSLEIIDGLQRLNSIFSFIENEFGVPHGDESRPHYFDLATLADTKAMLDMGELVQEHPVLDRELCRAIANYQLPVSTYREALESDIDEVFRRINSAGRQLSPQEIRQAGATSNLAQLIRKLAAEVRGDVSMSDNLPLNKMALISINNRELPYGINLEDLFWSSQEILDREAIRESSDEELVLDLVLDILLMPKFASSGVRFRDAAYGASTKVTQTSEEVVSSALTVLGEAELYRRFMGTLEVIRQALAVSDEKFSSLVVTLERNRGVRRHFHAIFVPICEMIYIDGMQLRSAEALAEKLKGFWNSDLQLPAGGGDFAGPRKRELFDMVKARLAEAFEPSTDPRREKVAESILYIEKILALATTEQDYFEVKQGFCDLTTQKFNDASFSKILQTLVAISNLGRPEAGAIVVGVADGLPDAEAICLWSGGQFKRYQHWYITGTQHELDAMGYTEDDFWRLLISKVKASALEPDYEKEVARSLRPVRHENHLLWLFGAPAVSNAVTFDGNFYDRIGPTNEVVAGAPLVNLIQRFPR